DVDEERSRHVRSTQPEWELQDMIGTNTDTARREEDEEARSRSSKSGSSRHTVGQEELKTARMTTVVIALVLSIFLASMTLDRHICEH
ncbi:hypothetical protein LTR95_011419, partial [Oleoguttula sp. CCFEE 5521]